MFPGAEFSFFALLIAGVAGFFGTLRTLVGMPMRFWMIPLAALLYVIAALITLSYAVMSVTVGVGIVFSAAFAYPIYQLFKRDFAKSIPPWLCKGCGYPLLGLNAPSCQECGERFDPEKVPEMATAQASKDDRLQ